jgi:hypothetical protein
MSQYPDRYIFAFPLPLVSGNDTGASSALAAGPLIQRELPATGLEFALQGTLGSLKPFPSIVI